MKLLLLSKNNQLKEISIPLKFLESVCSEWVRIRTKHKIGPTISNCILEAEKLLNSKIHYVKLKNSNNELVDSINLSDKQHKYLIYNQN